MSLVILTVTVGLSLSVFISLSVTMRVVVTGVCSRHTSGPSGKDTTPESGGDKVYVESVLNRHAKKLLSAFRLHDLAFFAANLHDYELVGWLRKERYKCTWFCQIIIIC